MFLPFTMIAQSSSNLSLVGSYDYSGVAKANDIWGYVDNVGVEYALVGLETGFSVVSLADPANPAEMFFIPGQPTVWRDVKVWGHYAYVTSDNTSEGLLIVDLNDMTGNTYLYTTEDNNGDYLFSMAHNIYIDEFGKAYAFGGNVVAGSSYDGALIFDVTQTDLANNILPTNLGHVDQFYLHDGMARGDTLWGSAIYEGSFFAIDVSDPANPVVFNDGLAFHETPNVFTHNCWISDDGNTLFTTDEISGAYVAAYDVSDLSNIYELDRIQSSPDLGIIIPHNTHVMGNFLVTSYYTDGVVVHDATYPNYMLEVGHYDAYEGETDEFDGCWGAYPYLPSGLILATDRNSSSTAQGVLWVLEPSFEQGCYLDGTVTDALSGNTIFNASISFLENTMANIESNLTGYYFTGLVESGSYEVVYSYVGYFPDTITVYLENGVLFTQDVALIPIDAVFGCMDEAACNYNALAEIEDYSCVFMELSYETVSVSCNGGSDGEFSITVDGGLPNYIFEWADGMSISTNPFFSLSGQPAGFYTVEVSDDSGCNAVLEVEVVEPEEVLTSEISGAVVVDVLDDESYSVEANEGSLYEWLLEEGGSLIVDGNMVEVSWGASPGSYTISVVETDVNGCVGNMVNLIIQVNGHSGINVLLNDSKKVLKITDLLGKEVKEISPNTSLFYIYNDGTVEKKVWIQ